MGYYTHHKLEVHHYGGLEDHQGAIQAVSGYDDLWEERNKWYSHEEDMREYSKKFPLTLFALEGEGEEQGDVWCKYFQNGKMQECRRKFTIDPFDESKLI